MKRLIIAFSALALAVASAATSYHVRLFEPSIIGGTVVKPGDYKIELKDNRAFIKDGKTIAESDVKVETNGERYTSTTVRYANNDGKLSVQEIRLGGTNTKLVFSN
jgi:hypothetical protein